MHSLILQQKSKIYWDNPRMLTIGHIYVFTTDTVCRYKISP